MPPRMKIIIFEFSVLIKYFLYTISILGILVLAHQQNLVQANVQGDPKKIGISVFFHVFLQFFLGDCQLYLK